MIKLKNILLEIGEGTAKPYKYKLTRTESDPDFGDYFRLYEFVTDLDTHYEVMFEIEEDYSKDEPWEFMNIEYGVDEKDGGGIDYKVETNKGELFRVMATIVDITKSILKERKNIKQLVFTGAKNRGEDDQRRNKLYMAYIRKHVPNIKNIEDDGSEIRVDI
jgi:hypothetical protein